MTSPITTTLTESTTRITRDTYPEIIQAARWMDEDHGTPNFEPGVGFIVDDPDGLTVPVRWLPFLPTIEQVLAELDHVNPHPLDVDTIDRLKREGAVSQGVYDSEAYCFISGEHTPQQDISYRSSELYIASRFFDELMEGWQFDPSVGFTPAGATS